jgi:hypothetical protein
MRKRLRALPTFADMAKAFGAIDAMLDKLSQGWIHEIQGHPVFRNPADGTWYDIPAALSGWIALWERINAHQNVGLDLDPLHKLAARLHHGTPITPAHVAQCADIVKQCKRHYRRMDVFDIGSLVKTQLIANQVELARLTENR